MKDVAASINWKKISLYILIAFGWSWAVALAMKLFAIELGTTISFLFVAGLYMSGPAIATFVVQKSIYKGSFKKYGWVVEFKNYKWFLNTILIFLAIIACTFIVILILGNTNVIPEFGRVDFSRENFNYQLEFLDGKIDVTEINLQHIPPWLIFLILVFQGIIAGITVNIPFMFGEEFGWRGLMLKETQPLGFLKANLFIGSIWGLWHLPLILMGHNYPNHPYLGVLMMCVMTISLSPLFAYVRLKTKSILGACMLHGMINATGMLFVLFVANRDELFSSIAGWAGVVACLGLTSCIYIFDKTFVKDYIILENERDQV